MSRHQRKCSCGDEDPSFWSSVSEEYKCATCCEVEESQAAEEFESRVDVAYLNAVTDIDELKEWIKEHLLK